MAHHSDLSGDPVRVIRDKRPSPIPAVSLVVPTKNRNESLRRLLASIRRQQFSAGVEIIVVDDGSEGAQPEVDDGLLISLRTSVGACQARNLGTRYARGSWILYMDDDAELADVTAVAKAHALACSHPNCGAIGFRQVRSDGADHHVQPARSDQPCRSGLFFSYGCLVSSELLRRIGGFNERFGYYYEEVELSLRINAAGKIVLFAPTVSVIHHEDSRGRDWRRIERLIARNTVYTVIQLYPWYLVPPAAAKAVIRFVWNSRFRGGMDWTGVVWILKEAGVALPHLIAQRKPIQLSILRRFRSLNRTPELLSDECIPGGFH